MFYNHQMSDITTEVIKKKKTISWVLAPFTSVALELAKQKTKSSYQKYPFFLYDIALHRPQKNGFLV